MPLLNLRVLVVDDNASDRAVARAMVFRLKPAFVHEAENGTVAEAKLQTGLEIGKPYNLMILDWNMPGTTNGLKLLQYVRAHSQLRNIKIIVMTGTAAREVVEAAIKNGADDFVVKPLQSKLLAEKIERFMVDKPSKPA